MVESEHCNNSNQRGTSRGEKGEFDEYRKFVVKYIYAQGVLKELGFWEYDT